MNDLKKKMTNQHFDLFSTEETRQNPNGENIKEHIKMVKTSSLTTFVNHPFHVTDDEKMEELKESIKNNGILTPILVRKNGMGGYEIISGHRRKRAAELLALDIVPVVIRKISDEESIITMVDSNIQRETLLHSEKAFAYRMKLEAIQNKNTAINEMPSDGQVVHAEQTSEDGQVVHKKSRDILAENNPDSGRQIQRYIRLTYLVLELLELVDLKKLSFNAGVELSYLKEEEQKTLFGLMEELQTIPSLVQATKMKLQSQESKLDKDELLEILIGTTNKEQKINLSYTKIRKFFPDGYSTKEMEKTILSLLTEWKEKNI